jgi:hypothetical protein
MEMKKGKANVPPQMRGQYKKQQEMAKMQREMSAATKPGADGLPVFNLFVRTKRQNVSCIKLYSGKIGRSNHHQKRNVFTLYFIHLLLYSL